MIYHDHIAISIIIPACIHNYTGVRCIHSFPFVACNIDAPVIGTRSVIKPGEVMFVSGPDKSAIANGASADRVTGTRTKHPRRGRILTCYTEWRAPRDKFAPAAGNDQPCSWFNIWICKIANRSWIQIVSWVVKDVLR